jgi:hypothetical protein
LIDRKQQADWQNRAHFFGFSAQVMRHIPVDLHLCLPIVGTKSKTFTTPR